MRATSIKIENLKAFRLFESELPGVCILQGTHGSGKSSIEEILKYALGRRPLADKGSRGVEHDPGMLRIGAEKGFAEIKFSDDSDVEILRVTVTRDTTKRETKTRGSKRWTAAAAEIDAFAEAISYDPMVLKAMSAKDRVAALLKVMPIQVDWQEIHKAINGINLSITQPALPSLDVISTAHTDIETQRRNINREAKSLTAHAEELEAALPPDAAEGQNWTQVAGDLDSRISLLKKTETDTINRLTRQVSDVKSRCADDKTEKHRVIDLEINAKIAVLERERESLKHVAVQAESDVVDATRDAANKELTEVRTEIGPEITKLTAESASARTQAEAQQRTIGTREAAKKARESATEKEAQSERMTAALTRLAALKTEVAGRMKIPGLTIESPGTGFEVDACRIQDGKLVPFSLFNDSDKDLVCLRVAVLARGSYGLVCVDDISGYIPERREKVIAAARQYSKEAGMQFILGEAVDGDLKVVDAS